MASSHGIIQLWVFPTEPEGPSINDVMQEGWRGWGSFFHDQACQGGEGGGGVMRYMTSYLEKTQDNIRGKGEEIIKNQVKGTYMNIYISPGILVKPEVSLSTGWVCRVHLP